jgi:Holliday junction DNA helicase RuvA
MIGHLEGRVLELVPGRVVVEAAGVGYEVNVPLSAHRILTGKERIGLHVHTHVREEVLALYGFPTRAERDAFRALIAVAGVGPRIALALLSGLSPDELAAAVAGEEWKVLAAVPGIGRRTAERLVVELKGKLAVAAQVLAPGVREDAVSALVNLGYPLKLADEIVAGLLREEPEIELGELLRRALRALTR